MEDRKRGNNTRSSGATSFQVTWDGGMRTRCQPHDDRGVHQQPQAGCQEHWGDHRQASRENRAPPSPEL